MLKQIKLVRSNLFFRLLTLSLLMTILFSPIVVQNTWAESTTETSKPLEKPTLKQLYPSWWGYIAEKPELSTTRLLALIDQKTIAIISDRTQSNLKQINTRIEIWNKRKSESVPEIASIQYKQIYSFEDLLEETSRLRSESSDLRTHQQKLDENQRSLKRANTNIDKLMAQYIQIKKDHVDKQDAALAIINLKMKSEILVEEIRLLKKEIEQRNIHIMDIDKHIQFIKDHIKINDPLETLEEQVNTAKLVLNRAKNEALNSELESDHLNTGSSYNLASGSQKFASKVTVIEKELDLILASIKLDIKKVSEDSNHEHDDAIYIQAKNRNQKLAKISGDQKYLNTQGRHLFEKSIDSSQKNNTDENIKNALKKLATLDNQSEDYLALNQFLLKQGSSSTVVKQSLLLSFQDIWNKVSSVMGYSLFKLGDTPVTAMSLIRLLLIIFIGLKLAKNISKVVIRLGTKNGDASSGIYTLSRLVQYVVISLSIIIGLSSIGIDFTKLAFLAGALSIGIGFGLQSIVNNFVSGLILLFERTLRVGDVIQLSDGLIGRVKEINVRSTLVTTADNIDLIVPNAELLNNQLTNLTLKEQLTRIHVPFGVAYGTNKELVKAAALAAIKSVDFVVKDKESYVWLVNFGDSSLDFELVVWVNMNLVKVPGSIKPTFLWNIETELGKRGIEIPFPQRDLHLRSVSEGIKLG